MIRRKNQSPTLQSFTDDFFGVTSSIIKDILNEDYSYNYNYNYNRVVNVLEDEKTYELSIALPGYKKEDISIDIDHDELIVSCEIKEEKDENGKNYITKQLKKTSFTKKFILSEDVNKDKIKAKMEDGILNITLERIKKEEVSFTKKINID